MRIEFATPPGDADADTALAIIAFEDGLKVAADLAETVTGGAAGRALALGRFKGREGQALDFVSPDAAARAYAAVKSSGVKRLRFLLQDLSADEAAHAAFGVTLAAYRFDRYRTRETPEQKTSVEVVEVVVQDSGMARDAFSPLSALSEGIRFGRDLVSEPANVLYPEEFARRLKALEAMGLQVEVLGEADMERLGMGSLLCVGLGSVRESQLAVVQWRGASDPDAQPIAFIGKGVCFDTGGISLKPADGMEDMKWDMGGAGAVAGLMHVLAGRKAKLNAIGILGLVENMPDGKATRPGDVVTSMSGQTIEVINTDAEGRLVLADALWYCQARFKPKFMIDLATLTGAIIISLGHDYAGLFSNDDALAAALLEASEASAEGLWRLPLPSQYEKQFESMIADMKNIGGRPAGAITAALILQKFVNGVPWAHLDIASVAWKKPSSNPLIPDGATGFGVRLLNQLVADRYEG